MNNQAGIVTMEFIFSLVIAAGLSVVLFTVTYTLSVIEVTQYVVFATARAHAAAQKTPEAQRDTAMAKFKQLTTGKSAIGTLYGNGWFDISKEAELDIRGGATAGYGKEKSFSTDLAGGSDPVDRQWFLGVSTAFTAKVMTMNLPLIGKTDPEEESGSFKTRINAMLIREPSQSECRAFLQKRQSALSALPSAEKFYDAASYIAMEDNGC